MIFTNPFRQPALPTSAEVLPGRDQPIATAHNHFVSGAALKGPYPAGHERAMFGMGCFWGAEKAFWTRPGVLVTAVGYAGGQTANPTYREVCTGLTAHNEVVFVVFDPRRVSYDALLKIFWEGHDPTQGMRQGNDVGTQYRSGIYVCSDAQREAASRSLNAYQKALDDHRGGSITTEIIAAPPFYFAEAEHQQYLARNPSGYCGLGGTGVGYCAPEAI